MPAEVIDRVHVLAHCTVGAEAAGLAFTEWIGKPFLNPDNDDSSTDETYTLNTSDSTMDDDYDSDDDDTDSEQADNNDDHPTDIPIAGVYNHSTNNDPIAGMYNADENYDQHENLQNDEMAHQHQDNNEIENEHNNQEMDDGIIEHENLEKLATYDNGTGNGWKYGSRTNAYLLRPRKPRDYGHLHATLEHTAMTQNNMKKA